MRIPNPPIKTTQQNIVFGSAIAAYILLAIAFFVQGTQWVYDAAYAITILLGLYVVNKWIRLGITGFILLNTALIIHLIGGGGMYGQTWGFFGYDSLVHIFASMAIAYVAFNFVARRLHVKQDQRFKQTSIDNHTLTLIFLVFAITTALGIVLEVAEFGGYMFFGEGEGMFFVGQGDVDTVYGNDGNYVDTMGDILFNTLGAILGTLLYYYGTYKHKPWMKYI